MVHKRIVVVFVLAEACFPSSSSSAACLLRHLFPRVRAAEGMSGISFAASHRFSQSGSIMRKLGSVVVPPAWLFRPADC
eukprot:7946237-Pyramimonas_sp.AAC.1